MTQQKRQIHILGGGIGALTAAYYLSDTPGWETQYDITLYQLGWRLGGKGASSRDPQHGSRIEEHGLHCWFGFYQNAFSTVRRIYAELDRPADAPLATADAAFTPRSNMSMLEKYDGEYSVWPIDFPAKPSKPGEEAPVDRAWTVIGDALRFLAGHLDDWLKTVDHASQPSPDLPDWLQKIVLLKPRSDRDARHGLLHQALQLVETLESDHPDLKGLEHALLSTLLKRFRQWMQEEIGEELARVSWLRRLWIVADLVLSVIIGLLDDGVLENGLTAIDGQEFRDWIASHHASQMTVDSTPVKAIYAATFCYDDGDLNKPNLAAGVAVGLFIRIGLMYRGHVLYEMNAGMGDVVATPFYELLKKRGVRFEFFSRVTELLPSGDGERIAAFKVGRQVTLKADSYAPLAWCAEQKMHYWPPRPLYEQIQQGAELEARDINLESWWSPWQDVAEETIELGANDQLVLGISLGGLGPICAALAEQKPRWRKMLDDLPAIQTLSAQLWMTRSTKEMGWAGANPATMVAAPGCFGVWADMSHLLQREDWPQDDPPRSLQYLCGPLPGDLFSECPPQDHGVPALALGEVFAQTTEWLSDYTGPLWPAATQGGASTVLNWGLLYGSPPRRGPLALGSQYLRANIDPTERCIGSPAEGNLSRMPAQDSGYANLVLAGDWTRTAINAGCVESATMSGMAASRALCGHPEKIAGEHFLQA